MKPIQMKNQAANQHRTLAFIMVLFLAAFFRLYRIDQYMIFLGDEGRDAIVIKAMVDVAHFPLIGPPTSV